MLELGMNRDYRFYISYSALRKQMVIDSEVHMLDQIAGYLRLTQRDFVSIKAMFVKDQDNAYKILKSTSPFLTTVKSLPHYG
jgi:hypothetical protein